MKTLLLAMFGCALASTIVSAHAWTVNSTSPGVSVRVAAPESEMIAGDVWDPDHIEECPPIGANDTRCSWNRHTGGDPQHEQNGVLGVVLDGSSAGQSAVITSDVWPDSVNSAAHWFITYDIHFVVVNTADLTNLKLTSRYKYAGVTELQLSVVGHADTNKVEFVVPPTHNWVETPEDGPDWTLELTASRTTAGAPAMIWVDNIHVTENNIVLFDEGFPEDPAGVNAPALGPSESAIRLLPNPVFRGTDVRFKVPRRSPVAIEIFDVEGRLVRSLLDRVLDPGPQAVRWDGADGRGAGVPPGIYTVRVRLEDRTLTAKALRLR